MISIKINSLIQDGDLFCNFSKCRNDSPKDFVNQAIAKNK